MSKPDLTSIKNLIETSSSDEANKFLKDGWLLIDTYKLELSYEGENESLIYVLGKIKE